MGEKKAPACGTIEFQRALETGRLPFEPARVPPRMEWSAPGPLFVHSPGQSKWNLMRRDRRRAGHDHVAAKKGLRAWGMRPVGGGLRRAKGKFAALLTRMGYHRCGCFVSFGGGGVSAGRISRNQGGCIESGMHGEHELQSSVGQTTTRFCPARSNNVHGERAGRVRKAG